VFQVDRQGNGAQFRETGTENHNFSGENKESRREPHGISKILVGA